eukprot:jgi/Tetstr1/449120/TSEL_036331.t1
MSLPNLADKTKNGPLEPMIFKEFIDFGKGVNVEKKYKIQASVQMVARMAARQFNNAVAANPSLKDLPKVKYTETSLVSYYPTPTQKPRHLTAEKPLKGEWLKWVDNTSKKNMSVQDQSVLQTLETYAHWTFETSKKNFMVVDLQGLKLKSGNILLTDPAIHCCDMSLFGDTNMGLLGFTDFFATHHCNSRCRALGLDAGMGKGKPPLNPNDLPVLLLRGTGYRIHANVANIRVEDRWRFQASNGGAQYLDASVLAFNGVNHAGVVDYKNKQWSSIRHSGDVIDNEQGNGLHTIDIALKQLHTDVTDMFLTISGWQGVTLDKLRQPFLRIRNPDDKNKLLCQFNLGKHTQKELSKYRSVIMCHMKRSGLGLTEWDVTGVGELGLGAADEYRPLIQSCQRLIKGKSGSHPFL